MIAWYRTDRLLHAEGLSLSLAGRPVLADVSLEIRDLRIPGQIAGQVVALLGPSGMGKTRLVRILAGLTPADRGEVRIGPEDRPVAAGDVGLVAQSYPLFEHRTVRGNLLAAAQRARGPRKLARSRADELLERFRMSHRASAWPCELSGGERQRVAIAQQLLCSEHYLLLDEPFSGLDPIAIESVCEVIREVASANELNTVILVTHDVPAALAVADTLWLLGRARDADGNPVPGARVVDTIDLLAADLAWHPGIESTPQFQAMAARVRAQFRTL